MEVGSATSVGGVAIDVREISLLEIRMFIENLFLAHSGSQPAEHIPNRNAKAPDAGFPAPLPRLDHDPVYCGGFHIKNSTKHNMPSLAGIASGWTDHQER